LLIFPDFVHSQLSVDVLGGLELVWVNGAFGGFILLHELALLVFDVDLFFIGGLLVLFIAGDFPGISDVLDLVLSLDDLTPVDKSFFKLVKILNGLFEVLALKRSGKLQSVELFDHDEVNGALWFESGGLLALFALVRLELGELVSEVLLISGGGLHD